MDNSNQQQNPLQKMMSSGGASPNQQGQDASGQKKGGPILDTTIQRVFSDLNNITRRVRLLEERFMDIRKKIELMEETSLNLDKTMHSQDKAMLDTISEQKKTISEMKEKMNIMIKELQGCAKLTDQKVLEKYISMWEPINYVTVDEMDRNVGHLIDLKMAELNLKIQQENFIKKEIERQLSQMKIPNVTQDTKSTVPESQVIKPAFSETVAKEQTAKEHTVREQNREQKSVGSAQNANPTKQIKMSLSPESEDELTYDDEVPTEDKKTPQEKDEVEEITDEISNMFRKKDAANGLAEHKSDDDDDEDSIENLIRK